MFDRAATVADAVLREGHVLYPYRASALKNRMRWQFGVLGPPAQAGRPGADASWCETQVVCTGTEVHARVRFLRVGGDDDGQWRPSALEEHDFHDRVEFHGGIATLERDSSRIRCRVDNTSTFGPADVDREHSIGHSLVAVHVMLGVGDGEFISSVSPPPEAASMVEQCTNTRLWPVLVGHDVVLACPIILYDHPEVAPESVGEWGDALEIEELLTLRVMTLTPEEQREAAATDPFARAVLDQATPDVLPSLHGRIVVGSNVRLHPRPGADAHDMFLDGREARVVGLVTDVDGVEYAQVLPDDPGSDMHEWFGRSWFFRLDEVEPS